MCCILLLLLMLNCPEAPGGCDQCCTHSTHHACLVKPSSPPLFAPCHTADPAVRVLGFVAVGLGLATYADLEEALQAGPVQVTMCFTRNNIRVMRSLMQGIVRLEWDPNNNNLHSVLLVGHGTDSESGKRYMIIRNSWTSVWGLNGDFWVEVVGDDYDPITRSGLSLEATQPVVGESSALEDVWNQCGPSKSKGCA